MQSKSKKILRIINFISWIIFIGLCIKTGAIIISFFVSLFINPVAAQNLYLGLNLSELNSFSHKYYSILVTAIIVSTLLKAYLFYLVISIFLKINLVHPFSLTVSSLIMRMSAVALLIGVLTIASNYYCHWLIGKGINLPTLTDYLGGGAEFIFFAGILYFISQVFNRGIEIQTENDLTI